MSMPKDAVSLHKRVREIHAECHILLNRLEQQGKTCNDLAAVTNIAYAMREAAELADDTRKRLEAVGELMQKIACALAIASGDAETIRTDYVTATPQCKMIATPPKRSTNFEAYSKLMEYLGVKKEFWANPHEEECVSIRFKGIAELISKLSAAGLPLPPGLSAEKTFPVYSLTMRKRKGVEEE